MPLGCVSNCCTAASILCPGKFGCPPDVCADFEIKRHDTQPAIIVSVEDCNGPLDVTGTIVEVSMWAKAKLKKAITPTDTYFALSDDIGFEQSMVGDIIVMDRVRAPEQMLITGHDETNKFIHVQRGYHGSPIAAYPRGNSLKIFRILNAIGDSQTVKEDINEIDGTTQTGVLIDSQLLYNWKALDTCLPGCYWIEFKLLKMTLSSLWFMDAPPTPSFTSYTPSDLGCTLGAGVQWVRKFPQSSAGYLVHITDSPTAENLVAN